jgi:hypothetical protein
MKKILVVLILSGMIACAGKSNQQADEKNQQPTPVSDTLYSWSKITDSGSWRKSYNFQLFSIGDTIWVFHSDGNWFSSDGINWNKSSLPNSIKNLAFLDYVLFKNAIYGLGRLEGNIETYSFRSEIYRTTDLRQWDTIVKKSSLPERFFYHPFVFQNKIWLIGGEDKTTQYADVWNSPDGVVWTKQKDNLSFGKRSNSHIIFFNNKLLLLDNDVWSSLDGLNWELETEEIIKGEKIFGYAPVVFDSKIWLLGCNRNGKFSSQVLVSSDGKNWQGQNAPWSPRGGIAATVHKGKVYMTGGKYGGTPNAPNFIYSNDLWVLSKNY